MKGRQAALRRCAAFLVLVFVTQPLGPANRAFAAEQQPAPPAAQFETRADLILIDANVVDDTGAPVPDLRPEEFVVAVDGRPRAIASVQFVTTDPPAGASPPPQPAHYSSNDGIVRGRQILIVADEGSLPFGAARAALASLDRFIDDLSPADQVAFVRLPGFEDSVEFTGDRERLREAVSRVAGKAQPFSRGRVSLAEAFAFDRKDTFTWQRAVDRVCQGETGPSRQICEQDAESEATQIVLEATRRSREALSGVEQLVANLRRVPGAKTLVLLSQGLLARGNRQEIQRIAAATAAARVSVYVLQLDLPSMDAASPYPSATRGEDERLATEGLNDLAAASRGSRFRVVGTGEGVFARVARELSGHYLIGIEPTDTDRDGRPHRLNVEVRRADLSVRARSQFTIDAAATASAAPVTPRDLLLELLRAPTALPGLPLRVAAFAAPGETAGRVNVVIGADVGTPTTEPLDVHVGFVVVDPRGTIAGNQLGSATLRPSGDSAAPLQYVGNFEVSPGDYTLRLAVVDAEGRAGSVHHAVAARLKEAGGVAVSDLVITTPSSGRSGVRPDVHLTLQGPAMQAIVEIAATDPRSLRDTRVAFEVAESAGGPAIVSEGGRFAGAHDARRSAAAVLNVGVLPAGRYVARAVVQVPGHEPVTTARPFDIAPRRPRAAPSRMAAGRPAEVGRMRPPIPPFKKDDVLAPAVVNPFIDHVLHEYSPSPAAREALEAIKAGNLRDPAKGSREIGDLGLAFAQGLSLLARDRPAEADAYFRAALRQSSDFIGAAFYLGATHAAAGRDRDAVGAWQTALIGEVGAPGIYPVLIDGLLRLGEAEDALATLAEAEPTFTDRTQYIRRLVQACALAGRYDQALPLAHEYLADRPDDRDLLFVAMQLIFEGHASGTLADEAAEIGRFRQYAERYEALNGPQALVVRGWRKALGIR